MRPCGGYVGQAFETLGTLALRAHGYLGIDAPATVFSATPDRGNVSEPGLGRLALRYKAPDLFAASGTVANGWDRPAVLASLETVHRALRRITDAQLDPPIVPQWYDTWRGSHVALGMVWCMVMEEGVKIKRLSTDDKLQVQDCYRRLHSLGIIHGDVSIRNLCRCTGSDATDGHVGRIGLINFGMSTCWPVSSASPRMSMVDAEGTYELESSGADNQ